MCIAHLRFCDRALVDVWQLRSERKSYVAQLVSGASELEGCVAASSFDDLLLGEVGSPVDPGLEDGNGGDEQMTGGELANRCRSRGSGSTRVQMGQGAVGSSPVCEVGDGDGDGPTGEVQSNRMRFPSVGSSKRRGCGQDEEFQMVRWGEIGGGDKVGWLESGGWMDRPGWAAYRLVDRPQTSQENQDGRGCWSGRERIWDRTWLLLVIIH